MDAADFETYVLPLLFFKRISDVHDEEHEAALNESDGDEAYALFPQKLSVPESGQGPLERCPPYNKCRPGAVNCYARDRDS